MRKLLVIIALFAISLSTNKFTYYKIHLTHDEVNIGNKIVKNYNMFIKTKYPIYLEEAYAAKVKLLNIINKKPNSKSHQKLKNIIARVPVFLQYCVASIIYNDRDMLTGKCYDKFREIEPDYGNSATNREAILENIVIHLGRYKEYDKAKKVALYTLKLYPNQAPTLYNLALIYSLSKDTKDFKNRDELGCFSYQALLEADRIGEKEGFYAPANYIRKIGFDKVKVSCPNFNFRKKLQELIKKEGF